MLIKIITTSLLLKLIILTNIKFIIAINFVNIYDKVRINLVCEYEGTD